MTEAQPPGDSGKTTVEYLPGRRMDMYFPAAGGPVARAAQAGDGTNPPPFYLVHGTADTIVNIGQARAFAAALADLGHRVDLRERAGDHAGVVLAGFGLARGRGRPATCGPAPGPAT